MAKDAAETNPAKLLTPAKRRAIRKQAEVEVDLADKRLRRRLAIAGIAVVVLWIFIAFGSGLQKVVAGVPVLSTVLSFFYIETTTVTVVGLFIVIYLDTLFFVIFPGELYFFVALAHGMNPLAAVFAAALGGMLGQ